MLAGALIGLGVAAAVPYSLLIPMALLACAPAASGSGQDGRRRGHHLAGGQPAGDGVVPARMVEFFRLNARRGDDMDSLYNVVKSFTGWQGFDTGLGLWSRRPS